jgi:hypothetical protein
MLVRSNDGAIDMMQAPIQLTCLVCLLLQCGQDPLPDAGPSPAIEAGGPAHDFKSSAHALILYAYALYG